MIFQKKPSWTKVRQPSGANYKQIVSILRKRNLHTVCEEALCPNIAECWNGGTATLMLLGDKCTRGCRFCSVKTGNPNQLLDPNEPKKAAETVRLMKLDYVVLTSVDRDDLPDGGASQFAQTIKKIHQECPDVLIEVLIPDFQGDINALKIIIQADPKVLSHNIETVQRLTPTVRDPRATYFQSLSVLEKSKSLRSNQLTKSSIMLGLGETREELKKTFLDLRSVGVDFLTLGQYLQPTKKHLEVVEFLTPDIFEELKNEALQFGFLYVASGPLVRSSYRAGEYFIKTMIQNSEKKWAITH